MFRFFVLLFLFIVDMWMLVSWYLGDVFLFENKLDDIFELIANEPTIQPKWFICSFIISSTILVVMEVVGFIKRGGSNLKSEVIKFLKSIFNSKTIYQFLVVVMIFSAFAFQDLLNGLSSTIFLKCGDINQETREFYMNASFFIKGVSYIVLFCGIYLSLRGFDSIKEE